MSSIMKLSSIKPRNNNRSLGFTLIELMITVAIIGILAAVAQPAYTQYIVRTNRAAAMDMLNEVMFEQERYQLRKRSYSADLTDLGYAANLQSDRGLYNITASVCGTGIDLRDCVLLTATPVANSIQANNGETVITLNSRGQKFGEWAD